MKADAMKAAAMKADAMKADAMKAVAMKADAMKADVITTLHHLRNQCMILTPKTACLVSNVTPTLSSMQSSSSQTKHPTT